MDGFTGEKMAATESASQFRRRLWAGFGCILARFLKEATNPRGNKLKNRVSAPKFSDQFCLLDIRFEPLKILWVNNPGLSNL